MNTCLIGLVDVSNLLISTAAQHFDKGRLLCPEAVHRSVQLVSEEFRTRTNQADEDSFKIPARLTFDFRLQVLTLNEFTLHVTRWLKVMSYFSVRCFVSVNDLHPLSARSST